MVHIMTPEKRSPWYTPVFRGIDWDVQTGEMTRACKLQYRSVTSSSVWLGHCSVAVLSVCDRGEHCNRRLLGPTGTQLLIDVWCVPHGGQQQVWSTVQCIQVLQA